MVNSKAFSTIIGHERVRDVLNRMIQGGRIPHALLFVGPSGIGKSTVAELVMRQLVPEGNLWTHPDVIELACLTDEKTGKRKSQISVQQVREARERLVLSASQGGWKLVWIPDADKLSIGAANALLKILEEPKGQTLFILRASALSMLPETIISRCQTIRFTPVAREQIKTALVKKGYDPVEAAGAARQAFGRPGRALRFLKSSEDRAHTELARAQAKMWFGGSIAEKLVAITKLLPKEDVNKKHAADRAIRLWQGLLRDELMQRIGCESLVTYEAEQVFNGSTQELIDTLKRAEDARRAIEHNTNPQLALEHILFPMP